jgi:hypothetical protein
MDGWRFPDQPQIHAEIICASLSLIPAIFFAMEFTDDGILAPELWSAGTLAKGRRHSCLRQGSQSLDKGRRPLTRFLKKKDTGVPLNPIPFSSGFSGKLKNLFSNKEQCNQKSLSQ